jgi:hypothetical protein
MDSLGDSDDLYSMPPVRTTLMTPEARAMTATGLVIAGLLSPGIFQYLALFLYLGPNGNDIGWQYTLNAGPSGALALAGAWIGWSVRDDPRLMPMARGLAVASAVVGAAIAVAVVVGAVLAFTVEPNGL